MIKSMTGFGKATAEQKGKKLCIEIRTLNSKQLDINLRLNHLYKDKESEIRTIISKELERGKIDISVYFENNEDISAYNINKSLLLKYYNELKAISIEAKNEASSDIFSLALRMPDIMTTGSQELEEDEWNQFKKVFQETLNQVNNFRIHEGEILGNDIKKRIQGIIQLLNLIDPFEKQRMEDIKKRIHSNLEESIGMGKVDPNRFEEELIYYLEKIDITEEKIRLRKHGDYFIETMKQNEANGRKLAFISQEIGRGINTIGSKANNADIQKLVVQMKDELEKVKEQLLNIL